MKPAKKRPPKLQRVSPTISFIRSLLKAQVLAHIDQRSTPAPTAFAWGMDFGAGPIQIKCKASLSSLALSASFVHLRASFQVKMYNAQTSTKKPSVSGSEVVLSLLLVRVCPRTTSAHTHAQTHSTHALPLTHSLLSPPRALTPSHCTS